MTQIDKRVFISYRRTNAPWALAIYQSLQHAGYDVFLDYTSIPSGDFESVILENIRARAHFIVLLTPSALERCNDPNDWLRREIECALDNKRNIIPIMLEGFDFSMSAIAKNLTGKLEMIQKYNAMTVPVEYFDAAMAKLCNQFLSIELDAVIHPISDATEQKVQAQKSAAEAALPVPEQDLSAQYWHEKGYLSDDPEEKIRYYSKAIRLEPYHSARSYNNRGFNYSVLGQYKSAIKDYDKAIQIDPEFSNCYNNRGNSYASLELYELAIEDYGKAIQIDPEFAAPVYNIACCYAIQSKIELACVWLRRAILMDPMRFLEGARTDTDFDSIRNISEFQSLIKEFSEKQ